MLSWVSETYRHHSLPELCVLIGRACYWDEFSTTLHLPCRMWKVFYDDVNRPGRYLLAKEQPRRPDATDIEVISSHLLS